MKMNSILIKLDLFEFGSFISESIKTRHAIIIFSNISKKLSSITVILIKMTAAACHSSNISLANDGQTEDFFKIPE